MRVHPGMQIVSPLVFCVTAGLTAPGVVDASGSELCARARLQTLSTEPRSSLRPATSPRALYRRRNRGLRAGEADFLGSGCRGPPHNAECGSRSPYPMPVQSGDSPPSDRPRTGGTRHGTGTLVDVDHHQIFPQKCFRISAPEVRTPWTGRSSSALRSARRGRRLTTRTAPHMSSTPFRLWLRRSCSSIRRAPRDVLIEQQRFAICTRTPKIS